MELLKRTRGPQDPKQNIGVKQQLKLSQALVTDTQKQMRLRLSGRDIKNEAQSAEEKNHVRLKEPAIYFSENNH